jgi:hypothetical protein
MRSRVAWAAGREEVGDAREVTPACTPRFLEARATLILMQLSEVFLSLGEDTFSQLIRQISIGKLKTYQLYETVKTRAHLPKLNTESLRKATPRFWARLKEGDEDFARDFAQALLVCHLEMIVDVLNFLGIPNQDGFFDKNLEASKYLTEGWTQRVWDEFRSKYPEPVLRLYINHLAWDLEKEPQVFAPAA